MSREPDVLLFLDLETTGTDETQDDIIEIGCVLTTPDLSETVSQFSSVVVPSNTAFFRLLENNIVYDMHEVNGLLSDLQNAEKETPWFIPQYVEDEVIMWLKNNGVNSHRVMLAGSGVSHFDRRFLKQHMPYLEAFLMYPSIDVGVIRRAAKYFSGLGIEPTINATKNHRALDDALYHLEEARFWKEVFAKYAKSKYVWHIAER